MAIADRLPSARNHGSQLRRGNGLLAFQYRKTFSRNDLWAKVGGAVIRYSPSDDTSNDARPNPHFEKRSCQYERKCRWRSRCPRRQCAAYHSVFTRRESRHGHFKLAARKSREHTLELMFMNHGLDALSYPESSASKATNHEFRAFRGSKYAAADPATESHSASCGVFSGGAR
jgi:hypothetical protein